MATRKKGPQSEEAKEALKAKLNNLLEEIGDTLDHEAPEGFTKQVGDIVGTWVRCSPIQGFPRSAKLMDSRIDDSKSAALILWEITAPCIIDVEGEYKLAEVGSMVGVWYKAGMRSVRWLRDVEVWMKENPAEMWKDVGKGNEMITFDIRAPKRGAPMLVLEDFRDGSAPFIDGSGKTVGLHDLEPKQNALATVPI
jgi:hypothetical protein